MRTIVDIPEEQLRAVDAWREARGISRAEAIRRALDLLLTGVEGRGPILEATRGLWADRAEDGVAAQRRLRDEWSGS